VKEMEIFEKTSYIISSFISSSILPWSVLVLVVAIIYKKSITKTIGRLISIKGYGFELTFFARQNKKVDKKIKVIEKTVKTVKTIKQINSKSFDSLYTDDNPEIAIPSIYSTIEKALKDKFGEEGNYNKLVSLCENKKITNDTFIVLDSMRSLRDNIHSYADSQKISKKDIDNYRHNAERIIKIIQAIEN